MRGGDGDQMTDVGAASDRPNRGVSRCTMGDHRDWRGRMCPCPIDRRPSAGGEFGDRGRRGREDHEPRAGPVDAGDRGGGGAGASRGEVDHARRGLGWPLGQASGGAHEIEVARRLGQIRQLDFFEPSEPREPLFISITTRLRGDNASSTI